MDVTNRRDTIPRLAIGCAGWSVPVEHAELFAATGTHLAKYGSLFKAVEINSSFYRSHQQRTYARWADSVPLDFRFSVKLPREITHELRLKAAAAALRQFLQEVSGLGERLGCLLVQLPPSLAFDPLVAESFFQILREQCAIDAACEPPHLSWFTSEADDLLRRFQIARVATDPAIVAAAGEPGGWDGMVYHRLHGSPRIYYSAYEQGDLIALAERLRIARSLGRRAWCIFDNTARGAAIPNAQFLKSLCPRNE